MRLLRIALNGHPRWAQTLDEEVASLWTAAPWEGGVDTSERVHLDEATLLPAVSPSKIVCVGRNYAEHAAELGNELPKTPLLFLKPPSSLLAHEGTIELPAESERVEHEAELGVVVGTPLRDASAPQALAGIAGVTCVNDVTARDIQRADVQFTRGKGFDTFCPCGPWIETGLNDLNDLAVACRVNGEVRQDGRTADMVWGVGDLLSYISRIMTLYPGDLVATGTPAGVGPLEPGDGVEVEIEGIGRLHNAVRKRKPTGEPIAKS